MFCDQAVLFLCIYSEERKISTTKLNAGMLIAINLVNHTLEIVQMSVHQQDKLV